MILVEEIIAVLIGGAIGSLLRFVMSRWINDVMPKNFPWGILFVNIFGCLLMGLLSGFLVERYTLSAFWRAGIFLGFLGGFTTFSSFSLDTIQLFQAGAYVAGFMYIFSSVVYSLLATALGFVVAKVVLS